MKVIIAGSREGVKYSDVIDSIKESGFNITEIVSGTARGSDKFGEQFAEDNGIPLSRFPANWNKHGKSAGYVRNTEMAEYADALIAIWDGESRGTKHMIDIANKKSLLSYIKMI